MNKKQIQQNNAVQAHPAQFVKGRPERRRQLLLFQARIPQTQ
jgi:hypothetical protein